MVIRKARPSDWAGIGLLLDQLDYPGWESSLEARVAKMLEHPDELLMVYESGGAVAGEVGMILGCISLHFIPQLGLEGDFARIAYFAVDASARGSGIGQEMEAWCEQAARERGCALMEVHCHSRRARAHTFYYRQGYVESPKYLIKKLT